MLYFPYTPPPGYYDQPFAWIFDADSTLLVNGQNYTSLLYVYIQGGWGDFILRRVVGINSMINPASGRYQIKDRNSRYLSNVPLYPASNDDLTIMPELVYPELSRISFDLYNVLLNLADPWVLEQEIDSPNQTAYSPEFGLVFAWRGTVMVVGAPLDGTTPPTFTGKAYVYNLVNGVWTLAQTITPGDGTNGDTFGVTVAISSDGSTIAIGSAHPGSTTAGAVYVYTLVGSTWTLQQEIGNPSPHAGDLFGARGLAIDGNNLLISSQAGSGTFVVYYYLRSAGTWTLTQTIANPGSSTNFFGYGAGTVLCIKGNNALIGAPGALGGNTIQGKVYVYTLSGSTWSTTQTLANPMNGGLGDNFGWSVAIDDAGLNAIVGSPGTINGQTALGQVAFFFFFGGSWMNAATFTSIEGGTQQYGYNVAMDNGGALALAGNGLTASVSVTTVLTKSNGAWSISTLLSPPVAFAGLCNQAYGGEVMISGPGGIPS